MQIHELNNYSGALDSGAYLAIDNGNDTGKISKTQLFADINSALSQAESDLNGRIDNIIAGGEAPSTAEIIDARRGANGVDYSSLGEAIRNQDSALWDRQNETDSTIFNYSKIMEVSSVASGGQSCNFQNGKKYRVVLTTTDATQHQIGTIQNGSYVDEITALESGNAGIDVIFTASGDASQFYVYLTPSSARYTAAVYEVTERYIDMDEFNSELVNRLKNYSTIIRNSFTSESDMWGIVNGSIGSDGLTMSQGGSAFHRKPVAFDDFVFSATFKITSGAIVGIATEGSWKSKITIDQSTSRAYIYTNYNDGQTLVEAESVLLSSVLNNNRFYRIELYRNGWNYRLKVVDCLNNISICDHSFSNFDNTLARKYGRFSGYFGIVCDSGAAICSDLVVTINHKACKCLMIGDSLTEGDQVTNDKRWSYLLKNNYFDGDAIIAGAGGDSTTAVKTRLQSYIDLGITFDVCIVLAGMNNRSASGATSYQTDISAIYNMIVDANAIPVIAVNPIPAEGADYIHNQRAYITSKGWNTIRFDYAFSPSYGYNSDYFNSDGIHPNEEGDAVMYQAAKTALTNLFL